MDRAKARMSTEAVELKIRIRRQPRETEMGNFKREIKSHGRQRQPNIMPFRVLERARGESDRGIV